VRAPRQKGVAVIAAVLPRQMGRSDSVVMNSKDAATRSLEDVSECRVDPFPSNDRLDLTVDHQVIMCGRFPPARISDLPSSRGNIPALLATPFSPPGRS
jgi:hypothetical protein